MGTTDADARKQATEVPLLYEILRRVFHINWFNETTLHNLPTSLNRFSTTLQQATLTNLNLLNNYLNLHHLNNNLLS